MINRMRNAFLKLSPTYQLRTQVEQWYDADGTEEHVTNPIEIVRSILCTESNVRRHSSELIRDADQRKFNAARAQTNDGW